MAQPSPIADRAESASTLEAEVQQRLNDYFNACRNGNLEQILSFFTPDIVAFDVPPVLRFRDRESYKQSWEKWFTQAFNFPVQYENREQKIHVSGDLALVHGLMHMEGTYKESGESLSCWLRHTMGLKKISGKWMIMHDHVSAPLAEDGRALMDLNPDRD